mgnify:FL=1
MSEKFLVMSLDDGVTQDERVISVFRKYALTATFNLNSGRLGEREEIPVPAYDGKPLRHDKVSARQVQNGLYDGFETACHGFTHAFLPSLDKSGVEKEIGDDYDELFRLTGTQPCGIAYAGPTPNYNETVIRTLKKGNRLMYGRTIDETHGFSMPDDFYRWNPTCQFRGDELLPRAEEFFDFVPDKGDALFFVWGHSYEFDLGLECWDKLEYFCKEISARKDITCLTCKEFYERFGRQ